MRCELTWSQCPSTGTQAPVSGVCATKQRDRVYAAAGSVVQVIDRNGQLLKTLETQHPEISYVVAHPSEEKIVTVGLDAQVVFMDTSGTPLFKYGHNTEVQCCAFSPDGQHFLTGADGDIGVYSNGAQRVNKIRIDAMVRSLAWSPSSKWFVIGTNQGALIFMDVSGKVFNRCETGAPIWAMKVVLKDVLEPPIKEEGPIGAIKNEVGVYQGNAPEQKLQPELKKKLDQSAESFIKDVKAHEERLVFVSWDQKYRVINPGSLSHSGVLVEMKRAFSGGRKKRLQSNENPFLLAEARLPFIPLCFEFFQGNYVLVSGVGGKITILAADSGSCLMDVHQLSDLDPLIVNAPRSKVLSGIQRSQVPQKVNTQDNTLAYFGLNSTWVFSMCLLTSDLLVLGLQRGITVGLQIRHKSLDSGFRSIFAAREGLTSVVVKDVQTGSVGRLQLQTYVSGLAVSQKLLLVQTPGRLDVYELRDPARARVTSVDDFEGEQLIQNQKIELKWLKQHSVSFRSRFMGACAEHFVLGGRDFIAAFDLEGTCITSWRFKDTQINCMKVIGGAPGAEGVVLGTQDGRVLVLRIGSRFSVEAVRHVLPINSVEVSADRSIVAVVDSASKLTTYEFLGGVQRKEVGGYSTSLYSVPGVKSAAFDQRLPDVLAVSQGARISVIVQGSILYTHAMPSSVRVLVQDGRRNYSVSEGSGASDGVPGMSYVTDIPLSPCVTFHVKRAYQFMAKGLWDSATLREELDAALSAAALGVPGQCYVDIAVASLLSGELDYAEEGLARVGDVRALQLVAECERNISTEGVAGRRFSRASLALLLAGDAADAALLRAAAGDATGAVELLYFVRRDAGGRIGPYTSLLGAITQRLLAEALAVAQRSGGPPTNELRPLPNLALYFRLGTSEEDITKYRQEMLRSLMEKAGAQHSKYLEYLQIYDPTAGNSPEAQNNANNAVGGYSYNQDYRILLRRELQTICQTQAAKQEILVKHAQFLEKISDWQAAAASYLDCGECERAVRVLITSEQVGTLLGLIRALPAVNQQQKPDYESLDIDFETGPSAMGQAERQQIISSLRLALSFFERRGDFENSLLIAQRLGDHHALLRLFITQNMWDAVEDLGKMYPEMMPAIHEARAAAFLREGKFLQALERLRLAGNQEKEISMIQALIEAAVAECRFGTARQLTCQLWIQLASPECQKLYGKQPGYQLALNALRARVLVYSGYMYVQQYARNTLGCPDPNALGMIDISKLNHQGNDEQLMAVCTFLANFAGLSGELTSADKPFLQRFERLDVSADVGKSQQASFVESSTRPSLGRLSTLNLTDSGGHGLPSGVAAQLVWLSLQQAAGGSYNARRAADARLAQLRLPGALRVVARQRALKARAATVEAARNSEIIQKQENVESCICAHCGAPFEISYIPQAVSERDLRSAQTLPPFSPTLSDTCKRCGVPAIRSALSLKILPLVLVQPEDGVTEDAIIQAATGVQINDVTFLSSESNIEELIQAVRTAPVTRDGEGARIPLNALRAAGPGRSHVVQSGGHRRVVIDLGVRQAAQCTKCCFFFAAEELEVAAVTCGRCPICGGTLE